MVILHEIWVNVNSDANCIEFFYLFADQKADRINITNSDDFDIFLKKHFDWTIHVSYESKSVSSTSEKKDGVGYYLVLRNVIIGLLLITVYVVLLYIGIYCRDRLDMWFRYREIAKNYCREHRYFRECYDVTFWLSYKFLFKIKNVLKTTKSSWCFIYVNHPLHTYLSFNRQRPFKVYLSLVTFNANEQFNKRSWSGETNKTD